MSRIPPLFLFNTIYLSLFLFASKTASQVVGCDALDCGQRCSLGNVTAASIGVTNFNTSLSSEPLTWTVGISTDYVPEDSSNATYERAYFLGTPPGLSLANSTYSQACALFFEGVSQNINTTDGACGSALGSACVGELLSQAQGIMNGLSGNSTGGSVSHQCEDLMKAIQTNVPNSCAAASDQNWGTIFVRDLTGTNALSTISQSTCHATTGENYQLSLVDTYTEEYEYNLPILSQPFLMGTTPILSIFFPFVSSQNTKSSEAHLSCLRVVPSTFGSEVSTTTIASTSAASKSSNSFGFLFGMVILARCWNSMF